MPEYICEKCGKELQIGECAYFNIVEGLRICVCSTCHNECKE